MRFLYAAKQVRDAEQPLLEQQTTPDQLMQQAAARVADVAEIMLDAALMGTQPSKVLLLVGPGGNGGDALYAGAQLLEHHAVDAVHIGHDGTQNAHGGLAALSNAGGQVLPELPEPQGYQLIIDGIAGLGSGRALDPATAAWLALAKEFAIPVLAIDVPSGVAADSGEVPEAIAPGVPAHVQPTVTITFGGFRIVHGLAQHHCGQLVAVDLQLDGLPHTLASLLESQGSQIRSILLESDTAVLYDFSEVPDLLPITPHFGEPDLVSMVFGAEPEPSAHKYSGGVVSVLAGSSQYPGAGQLCALAATRATSYGVRMLADANITAQLPPEILRISSLEHNYSSHAYVAGPGRGTDKAAREELSEVLASEDPIVLDADAITLLHKDEQLLLQVRDRTAPTVLTPHEGEFERLAGKKITNRVFDAFALAYHLRSIVVLKGRATVIAGPEGLITVVDAGSSWAATPGSGDVLSGIIGAYIAQLPGMFAAGELGADLGADLSSELVEGAITGLEAISAVESAVVVHATAARLAARTEYGPAPITASDIVQAISPATAYLQVVC